MSKTLAEQLDFEYKMNKVFDLAADMAGYIHHIGYPVYDGGHTEPEATCMHEDCKAVREAKLELPSYL